MGENDGAQTVIRRTPIRKVRPGTRRGQPTKAEKKAIRAQVYEETGGRCEIRKHPNCRRGVLPPDGEVVDRWHLVHLKAKRVHGWARENLCGGCYYCHIEYLHNACGKPCPPKEPKCESGKSVHFVFNETHVTAQPGEDADLLQSRWSADYEAAAKAYREHPDRIVEAAERKRKDAEARAVVMTEVL